ncbi:MAG: ATP-binding protein [Desulfobacula sp.]|nr:ATP-binding protein [Desulfobacula sp.]
MRNEFLITSRVATFREAISVLEDTVKGHPGIMVVWGRTGRGKTSCIEDYAVNHGAVYIYVENETTPLGLLQDICMELNGMEPRQKRHAKKIIAEELDETPRTLLIDEADKLCLHGIGHLKDIYDMTGTPIVLVGEPSIYGKLHAKEHFWNRVTRTVEFGPVTLEDVVVLGMKACDLKIKPEAATLLLKRCKGGFRILHHDLRDLEVIAKSNNLKEIDADAVYTIPKREIKPTPERD